MPRWPADRAIAHQRAGPIESQGDAKLAGGSAQRAGRRRAPNRTARMPSRASENAGDRDRAPRADRHPGDASSEAARPPPWSRHRRGQGRSAAPRHRRNRTQPGRQTWRRRKCIGTDRRRSDCGAPGLTATQDATCDVIPLGCGRVQAARRDDDSNSNRPAEHPPRRPLPRRPKRSPRTITSASNSAGNRAGNRSARYAGATWP